ncbi:hypothetical protein [Mycoplasmopsis arginini]|uniref:Uncharacterized protein n=1 Tax=Mycoplasmopsis arginini TaxID=2094 RepID=A0AA43R0W1_MYCAR|nr:hypothetical protein [Mycoplasmopsis arginini]ENY70092.1 Hypothetical protein, predicted transmembrane protein [Mycoplasmopsis arginini 7264]MCY2902983.1 hypothetical protein [Mycoplasmopsis arginini QMP CG1-2758]MDI3348400.1 hypothetical protein [Mycoplasmopsis arginini]MDI3349024.1 hypothetical protein [Mycoplasmopsis arginini]MDI3349452.1 hypothetical protein [Mycoplasmopsis arginini]
MDKSINLEQNKSKLKWVLSITIYSIILAIFFIVTLLYTQDFLNTQARSAANKLKNYEEGVEIFWFKGFRISLLVILFVLTIFFIVLFVKFWTKIKKNNKKDKIISITLFSINSFLLFLSFIYVGILIHSIDVVLWTLKYGWWEGGIVEKDKLRIEIIYYNYIIWIEAVFFVSGSLFMLISIFQIYHYGKMVHKKLYL